MYIETLRCIKVHAYLRTCRGLASNLPIFVILKSTEIGNSVPILIYQKWGCPVCKILASFHEYLALYQTLPQPNITHTPQSYMEYIIS